MFRKTWSPPRQQMDQKDPESSLKKKEIASRKRIKFSITLLLIQTGFIALYGCFAGYDEAVLNNGGYDGRKMSRFHGGNGSLIGELAEEELYPVNVEMLMNNDDGGVEGSGEIPNVVKKVEKKMMVNNGEKENGHGKKDEHLESVFTLFQDVHVMIFIGFGFLMTFLKKYGYSAVGVNMLLGAVVLQWATLCQGFFHLHSGKILINITNLLNADFATATVLISFGALLGKTSPLQLLVMSIIEIVLFSANEWIGLHLFWTSDVGASVLVHIFGAYFGLMVSFMLYNRSVHETTKEGANYQSDIFAMIGTIFLWLYWPSFNSALAPGHAQHRAVINTYFSLAACCVTSFAISAAVDKHNRFNMVHIQNSTLAGGVAIGTAADLMIEPYGALLVGVSAGIVSVLGYHFITPFLTNRLKIHDTCGVHNLHGMPGVLAGIVGIIMAAIASEDQYGKGLYMQYPMRAPLNDTEELHSVRVQLDSVEAGQAWSAGKQASYQAVALITTLTVAIIGGLLTGLILRIPIFDPPSANQLFDDEDFWEVPEEEPLVPLSHVSTVPAQNAKQDDSKTSSNGGKTELLNMEVF